MRDRQARRYIGLVQRERRTWYLDATVGHQRADQGTRQRGLPGPQLAAEGDNVTAADLEREQLGEPHAAALVEFTRPLHWLSAYAWAGAWSAAVGADPVMPFSGKLTVTRVPRPGSDSSDMTPPCNSTRLLTMERPRPAPRCLEP